MYCLHLCFIHNWSGESWHTLILSLKIIISLPLPQYILHIPPREVHPKTGPVPLDELAGVTKGGTCTTNEGPEVDLHIQRHPFDKHRNVNVLTMHNHISKELKDKLPQQVNAMKFQFFDGKSDAFLRVATLKDNPDIPNPLMTFGNIIDHVRLYEATPDITGFEVGMLKMTEWLRQFFDKVLRDALKIVAEVLGDSGVANSSGIKTRRHANHVKEKFLFPMGTKERSLGQADTTSSYIARDKPFSGHSDTQLKPDLHDNRTREYHEDMMDIPTQSFSFRTDPREDIPGVVLEMKHGIPKGKGSYDNCEYVGHFHFSSSSNEFISKRHSEWIPLGHEAHMHWQFPGSQGMIHHKFRQVEESRGKAIRLIISPRKFQHLHLTKARQLKYFQKNPHVIGHINHNKEQVLELLRSSERSIPFDAIKCHKRTCTEVSNEAHPTKKKSSRGRAKERNAPDSPNTRSRIEVVRTMYKNDELFDFEQTKRRSVI